MEIKRVIAGGLATFAAGATLVLGAGAVTTLGDFVTVTGSTMTSPYIVIGGNAAAEDTLAAADVAVALAGQATETVSVSGAQATLGVSGGDAVQTKSENLYLGQTLTSIEDKFDYQDLPVLLASGTLTQDDNEDVDYTQRLYTKSQTVNFNREESEWNNPELNLKLTKNADLYTYEVRFSPAVDTTELGDVEITLLGADYVFSDVATANTATKMTLFASSQTETITAGESITVNVGGTDYVITIVGINEAGTEVTVDVNGETRNYAEGDDIEEGDLEAHVKEISALKFPVESGTVELFVGSQSLVLTNGSEATLGGDEIDGANVLITNTTTKIREVEITYQMDDDVVLRDGESFTDPVFGGFDVAFGGIFPSADSAAKDHVRIEAVDDEVQFTFTNADGTLYEDVELLAIESSVMKFHDGTSKVHFCNNETIEEDEFVVVSDNSEFTYILEFEGMTGNTGEEEAVLKDVSTGVEYTITLSDLLSTVGIGSLDVTVTGFDASGETVALNNTFAGTGAAYENTAADIYTEEGSSLHFETNCSIANSYLGFINVTESTFETEDAISPDVIDFTVDKESGEDSVDNVDAVDATVDFGLTADDDNEISYGLSTAGTYIVRDHTDDEDDILDIYLPDEPTPVYVAFGSDPTFAAGEGTDAGTVEQAVQIKNSISKMESEVNTATLSRDLVLLGGPCANGLVAEVLEMSATSPECSTEFTALYPTEGVITVVEDAFSSGQKALVVAGVDRAATRDLAVKVMQGTLEYDA